LQDNKGSSLFLLLPRTSKRKRQYSNTGAGLAMLADEDGAVAASIPS